MMRGLLLLREGGPNRSRAARFVRPWLGGFNLLPYRQRNARLARQARVREWMAATLAGCTAILALAAWQTFEKARLDRERASFEQSLVQLSTPLAEHARLLRTQEEQRKNAARAASLSEPLERLLDLLEALSFEPGGGVVLRQLRQREHETELLATSRSHLASAEWLKRLSAIAGVKGAEIADLHRPVTRASVRANEGTSESVSAPVEFGGRLRWDDPAPSATRRAGSAPASPVKSAPSGGTQ
jgi:type IV pilus assembly protein PilN